MKVSADVFHNIKSDRWIHYGAADRIHSKMYGYLSETIRDTYANTPCMLILGDSGSGKTALLNKFVTDNPPVIGPNGELERASVLRLLMPPSGSDSGLISDILRKMRVEFSPNTSINKRLNLLKSEIQRIGLKMLVIDEFHYLDSRTKAQALKVFAVLKSLIDEQHVSIVAAACKSVMTPLSFDYKFQEIFAVECLNPLRFDEEYVQFFNSFNQTLPVPMPEHDSTMAKRIFYSTNGRIGDITDCLRGVALTGGRSLSV